MSELKSRKEKIIRVAVKVFAANPIASVRLTDIARQAKLSRPLVSYYYKDTEALFFDVILHILEDLKTMTSAAIEKPAKDVRGIFRHYVEGYLDWAAENPEAFRLWLYYYYLASFSPTFQGLNDQIRIGGRERIKQLLYRGIAEGEFPKTLLSEMDAVAVQIQGLMTGNVILAFTESKVPFDSMKKMTYAEVLKLLEVKESAR